MTFGIDKCKKNSIIKGKQNKQENYILDNNNNHIEAMENTDDYKYLGYKQKIGIEHAKIKEELKQKYKQRLTKILKTELTARIKTTAINTFAIPILTLVRSGEVERHGAGSTQHTHMITLSQVQNTPYTLSTGKIHTRQRGGGKRFHRHQKLKLQTDR